MIRKATEKDLDFLYELCLDMCSMAGYDKGGLVVDKESSFAYGRDMINGENSIVFIAEKHGKPIASIGLIIYPWEHNRSQKIAIEEWFYVAPEHRGSIALLDALKDLAEWWAGKNGATSLWMVSTDRKVETFYRRKKFNYTHSLFIKEIKDGT